MTSSDRRALVLGGATVLVAVLGLRVVPWVIRSALAAQWNLREQAALLARARADLAESPRLRDSAAVLTRAIVALAPKLLSGDTPAEAVADLSERLNLAASRNQVRLERTDQKPDSGVAGRLRRVRVKASVESDIRGVSGFLRAIELGEAVLSTEDLRIVAPDPSSGDRVPEVLRVELTVTGWLLENRDTLKDSRTVARKGKRET